MRHLVASVVGLSPQQDCKQLARKDSHRKVRCKIAILQDDIEELEEKLDEYEYSQADRHLRHRCQDKIRDKHREIVHLRQQL